MTNEKVEPHGQRSTKHRESFHPPTCICGPDTKRFGITCGYTHNDPTNPCPDNGDDEVAPPPTHLCSECVPFTHTEHKHVGNHRCACSHEWPTTTPQQQIDAIRAAFHAPDRNEWKTLARIREIIGEDHPYEIDQ